MIRTWNHTYCIDKYLEKLVKYNWLLKSWEWECENETELVWFGILWWTNGHRPFRSQTEWFTRFSRGNIWWGIWWIFNPQEKTSTGNGKKWNARGRIYRSDVYIRFGITLLTILYHQSKKDTGVLTKETGHTKIPVSWFFWKRTLLCWLLFIFVVYSVLGYGAPTNNVQFLKKDYFWCDLFFIV